MRIAALRPLVVLALAVLAALGAAAPAGAHGGAVLAEGGGKGVKILLNALQTEATEGVSVDLSTTIEGRGTGDGATVTYWIRPAGGKTFKATTVRDAAGIAHTDVSTKGRGEWRDWDVSAVVQLTTGERLRVSNAEANPPGPDPAATAGGGATGADDESGTSTDDGPTSGGTSPGTTTGTSTGAAPATTTGDPSATAGDGEIVDVSGKEDGAPWWAIASVPVILILAIGLILLGRRRAAAEAARGEDDAAPRA